MKSGCLLKANPGCHSAVVFAGLLWAATYTTVPGAEGAFMNEPRFRHNQRGNILNANYTEVGIGIVQGPNGSHYITQDLVAIPELRNSKRRN